MFNPVLLDRQRTLEDKVAEPGRRGREMDYRIHPVGSSGPNQDLTIWLFHGSPKSMSTFSDLFKTDLQLSYVALNQIQICCLFGFFKFLNATSVWTGMWPVSEFSVTFLSLYIFAQMYAGETDKQKKQCN